MNDKAKSHRKKNTFDLFDIDPNKTDLKLDKLTVDALDLNSRLDAIEKRWKKEGII